MKNLESLLFTRLGGHLTRFHTIRTIRETNVAEHSYGVANLLLYLTDGTASATLLKAALHHDVAEAELGDIPAPVKRRAPPVREAYSEIEKELNAKHGFEYELLPAEQALLKFADSMDMVLYAMEEILAGNRRFILVFTRALCYCDEVTEPNHLREYELLTYARKWLKDNVDAND